MANERGPVRVGPTTPGVAAAAGTPVKAPAEVTASLTAGLSIPTTGVPSDLLAAVKHAASLHNPEFYRRQHQRFFTFGPRFVRCYTADPDRLHLPRGLADKTIRLFHAAGNHLRIGYDLPEPNPTNLTFTGVLNRTQTEAVEAMTTTSPGVLGRTTGCRQDRDPCALIARHRQPTAIIVNKTELLTQRTDRIATFLTLPTTANPAPSAAAKTTAPVSSTWSCCRPSPTATHPPACSTGTTWSSSTSATPSAHPPPRPPSPKSPSAGRSG